MSLADTVAVVTGATRGIGKGIAVGLGEAGATVYVTGRSTSERRGGLAGTVDETAAEVTELGGRGVAVQCDHRVDGEVEQLFTRIGEEEGRLDLLVNNAFATPAASVLWSGERFWEFPGPRAYSRSQRCSPTSPIGKHRLSPAASSPHSWRTGRLIGGPARRS